MNKILGLFLVVMLCVVSFQTAGSQTVEAGIFNVPSGSNILVVRAQPSAALNGTFANVNVTIRWLTSYGVTLNVIASGYSVAAQGGVGTDGAFSYQTYGSVPSVTINWAAASENELFRVRVDGSPGTGTFSLMNGPAAATLWYFEFNGDDITDYSTAFYQSSAGAVALPIQLSSFTATLVTGSSVQLLWKTLSETDNLGFEVQRSLAAAGPFESIAGSFREGHGTTIDPQEYSYTDAATEGKAWYYRLKQMDRSGSVNYSEPVQASVTSGVAEQPVPTVYALEQNYPNPFNPTTTINFQLPTASHVRLVVLDVLGREVATLVNGNREAGFYKEPFNAAGLSSGLYFYQLKAGEQSFLKKMLLVK